MFMSGALLELLVAHVRPIALEAEQAVGGNDARL
jgi:hypothetical protein